MAGKNFLDFTKLTFNDIVEEIASRLEQDPRFENFRESAIAQTLLEIFAATSDLTNYYIERRAEEQFLETAKLTSSVIQLAKQIGYIITRPIPAQSTISMTIKGGDPLSSFLNDFIGKSDEVFIQLPIYKQFSFQGQKFLLKNTYKYSFTDSDLVNFQNPDFEKVIEFGLSNTQQNFILFKDADLVDIEDTITIDVIQGELKFASFLGDQNEQIDEKFQVYKINDKTFSNFYGEEDLNVEPSTKVAVTKLTQEDFKTGFVAEEDLYRIDRRSLVRRDVVFNPTSTDDPAKNCLLRTTPDQGTELLFGDGNFVALGADAGEKRNVHVRYISTNGANANLIGIVDEEIKSDDSIFLNNDSTSGGVGKNITQNLKFNLTSNITGGANIEDVESVKVNAPGIFQSLDRAVTVDDYVAILKAITSPINVKNAISWGEHDEGGNIDPIFKLFNVVLFSVFGELYSFSASRNVFETKDSDTAPEGELGNAILDEVDLFSEPTPNSYFELIVKEVAPGKSRAIEVANQTAEDTPKIGQVLDQLITKSQLTVKNVYVSPVIHEYTIDGSIFVEPFADATILRNKIKTDILNFLNENVDYNKQIFISNLVELAEADPGTVNVDIEINPTDPIDTRPAFGTSGDTFEDAISADGELLTFFQGVSATEPTLFDDVVSAFDVAYGSIPEISGTVWGSLAFDKSETSLETKKFMTEEFVNKTLFNTIYDKVREVTVGTAPSGGDSFADYLVKLDASFGESPEFNRILIKIHNSLSLIIKTNLMRKNGELTKNIETYTIRPEIVKIEFNANVFYKTGETLGPVGNI